nr:hypothetical protein [Pandoravirus massiliensis]
MGKKKESHTVTSRDLLAHWQPTTTATASDAHTGRQRCRPHEGPRKKANAFFINLDLSRFGCTINLGYCPVISRFFSHDKNALAFFRGPCGAASRGHKVFAPTKLLLGRLCLPLLFFLPLRRVCARAKKRAAHISRSLVLFLFSSSHGTRATIGSRRAFSSKKRATFPFLARPLFLFLSPTTWGRRLLFAMAPLSRHPRHFL